MKQWLINWLLKDIDRFELINHNNNKYERGRVIVHKKIEVLNIDDVKNDYLFLSLQDNNKTLKIFI